MEPIRTDHLTETYKGGPASRYGTDRDVSDLPCVTVGNLVVSCWRPSLLERLSVLAFGRVWLTISGAQPPVSIHAERNYVRMETL